MGNYFLIGFGLRFPAFNPLASQKSACASGGIRERRKSQKLMVLSGGVAGLLP